MKQLRFLAALAMFVCVLSACSKDNDTIVESNDNTTTQTLIIPAQDQTPDPAFDASKQGVYHGAVAATSSQARGKVWFNIGNDSNYSATIILVDGTEKEFEVDPELLPNIESTRNFIFISEDGEQLELDLNDFNNPVVTDFDFQNEMFTSILLKNRSTESTSVLNASFEDPLNAGFEGTWNIISDGTVTNPNGMNGDAIISLLITMNGITYVDHSFEPFYSMDCLGLADVVPVVNANGNVNSIVAANQSTEFAGGMAKWNIGYDPTDENYYEYVNCGQQTTGKFQWVQIDGGDQVRIGEITLDLL